MRFINYVGCKSSRFSKGGHWGAFSDLNDLAGLSADKCLMGKTYHVVDSSATLLGVRVMITD